MKDASRYKHAVILSGGGAKGALEVGVMKALFNGKSPATGYKPLDAHIFTGTSIGAYNAAFMVSQPETDSASTVDDLEYTWLNRVARNPDRCDSGAYRIRAN